MQQTGVDYLSLWFTQGNDYGCHDGEWKMVGGRGATDAIIIASEPLSIDTSTWAEIPEYHLLSVDLENNGIRKKLTALE